MASGCGGDGPERVVVSGLVTFEGEPIKEGRMRFGPIKDTTAPRSGAMIVDGRYTVDAKGGVPVGTHGVEIEAVRARGNAPNAREMPGMGAASIEQYIPDRYNIKTELQLTIEPDSPSITKDFDLVE